MLISPTMASMIEANTIQPVHAALGGGAAARSNLASVLVIGPLPQPRIFASRRRTPRRSGSRRRAAWRARAAGRRCRPPGPPAPARAAAPGTAAPAAGWLSCEAQRFAWRRETRLLTEVAVPAMTAVRATPRSNPGMFVWLLAVQFVRVAAAASACSSISSRAARTAWISIRPLATSCPPERRSATATGRRPPVLPDEHGRARARVQGRRGLLEILLADQTGRRALRSRRSRGPVELAEVHGGDGAVLALDHQRDVEHPDDARGRPGR